MVHRLQSLIKGDKCGDPKCFRDERRVVEESTLLTTVVQLQPVKMILLFSARSIGRTHTTEEYCTSVKIWSEFKGSCFICGQRSTDLPCARLLTERQILREKTTTLVSKTDGLHECESRNTSDLLIRIALMPKQEDTGEKKLFVIPKCYS